MKKILIMIFVGSVFLTGCGTSKTLTCTYNNVIDAGTTKVTADIDYKKDDVKKVKVTYDYLINQDTTETSDTDDNLNTDNDTEIVDGVVGDILDTLLDITNIKEKHQSVKSSYEDIEGFTIQNTTDVDNTYKVIYTIDFDKISDENLTRLNLSRNIDTLKTSYTNRGFTCE